MRKIAEIHLEDFFLVLLMEMEIERNLFNLERKDEMD